MTTPCPKVCVVMPVYNGAATIRRAIRSLLQQTYENWTCVIVDDGSTDDTPAILDRIEDPRFRIIRLETNRGRGYARKTAIANADGEYLAYLDADDFIHPDKLRIQVELFRSDPGLDLVGCGALMLDRQLQPVSRSRNTRSVKALYRDGDALPTVMAAVMVRTERARSFEYNAALDVGEDIDYFSRYLDGRHYANIPDTMYYYDLGTTSGMKIMRYTAHDIKRGWYQFRRTPVAGAKIMLFDILKLFVYGCTLPVLGSGFFIARRGIPATPSEIGEYRKTLAAVEHE